MIVYSIITYLDDVDCLRNHIESISKNTLFLTDKIEVIIIDPICSIESITLCDYISVEYTHNILILQAKNQTLADCYNLGIIRSKGLYLNFSLASSYFDSDGFDHIYYSSVDEGFPSLISMAPWTVNEIEVFSQYLISPRIYDGKKQIIMLDMNPAELMLCLQAMFIKRSLIYDSKQIELFTDYHIDTSQYYLMKMLSKARKYLYVSYVFYHYTIPLEDNTSAFLGQYDKDWYLKTMSESLLSIIRLNAHEGRLPLEIQRMVLWSIYSRFNCNYNDRNKGVLIGKEIEYFYEQVGMLLQYIDDKVIWEKGKKQSYSIPRTLRLFLLNIKDKCLGVSDKYYKKDKYLIKSCGFVNNLYDKTTQEIELPDEVNGEEFLDGNEISEFKICDLRKEHVIIDIINYSKGMISIDGRLSLGDFELDSDIYFYIKKDGLEYPIKYTEVYRDIKIFGDTYHKKLRFSAQVFCCGIKEKQEISFWVRINDEDIQLMIRSGSIYAHVSDVKHAYWRFDSNFYMYLKNSTFIISKTEDFSKLENDFDNELIKINDYYSIRASRIRKIYFERKPQKDKPIWVTFDKLYKAGDNGEYMYHYLRENVTDIDIYYVIKKDSLDYDRLIESDPEHVVVWGEDTTVSVMLLADVILATHANIVSNAGIDKPMIPYLSDLFCPFNVCIQHGLTVQNIAQYQNRIFDNTRFYVLASKKEEQNINTPIYGFDSKMLKITGMARYDGLKNNAKKQILISPTWRRNIANSNIAHFKKAHNAYFIHSEYYKIYNALINDKRLIECAKQNGYQIIYLIHPAASSQVDDFEKNEYVSIVPAAGDMNYEKILRESALMVTDYSGIQFDFAYMKKPIIYFHPSILPPHYEESDSYKYNRDSFGPVVDDYEELIDILCGYITDDCKMKEEFINRVDEFFDYHDHNNCERIYKAVWAEVCGGE